ncbi:lysozyme inhibitor LprI family protein [Sphingomonas solaris]|uniref:DUF1311 domain-containing protein n=1 Tax=Alterirhizorhabdus solaris TaxID=2529389 RepID=A0A558RCL3_9SPHN|nr:lysozyme inhibitor LprI family protein [Sphingomonas solaris]TVV77215.1 DUF1311 domain-containing protein [Sphingomonas solaris]
MSMVLLFGAAMAMADACGKDVRQAALNRCAATAYARADGALNRQWTGTYAAMKRRGAGGGAFGHAAALLASQRAWIAYRDAQCRVEGGRYAGGSAQGMTVAFCKANLTTVRAAQLKELIWQD